MGSRRLLAQGGRLSVALCLVALAVGGIPLGGRSAATPERDATESPLARVLRVLGISVVPQTKGPSRTVEDGDIWIATVTGTVRQRVTFDGGYRSPVFALGDTAILALKGGALVRVATLGGEPTTLSAVPGVVRLIGVIPDGSGGVLALTRDSEGRLLPGQLALDTGAIRDVPFDSAATEDQQLLNALRRWDRGYNGVLLTVESATGGSGDASAPSDVYYATGGQPKVNLSRCRDTDCGQPALSHDATRIVFVKRRSS